MKKLMFVAAAALCGTVFADVQSANIVGYNQVTLHPGFNMIAINWDGVTTPEQGIKINDLFPREGVAAGQNANYGDKVDVWREDGSGNYDTYFLYYTTKEKFTSANYHWVKSAGTICDDKLLPGRCCWYYSRNAEDVKANLAGAASVVDTSREIPIHPGFNMIGCPFTTTFQLNDASWGTYWEDLVKAGKASAGQNANYGDKIDVWREDGSGNYDTYFLYYTTKEKFTSANYKWVKSAGTVYTGTFAPLGMGLYYYGRGTGFNLQMPRPYAK